jgi:hypothetical protein
MGENAASLSNLNTLAFAWNEVEKDLGSSDAPLATFTQQNIGTQGYKDSTNGYLAKSIANNPGLQPILARAMLTWEANLAVTNNPDGSPNEQKQKEALAFIIKQQLNTSGWVRIQQTNQGVPLYAYAPGLGKVQQYMSEYESDPLRSVSWDPVHKAELKEKKTTVPARIPLVQRINDIYETTFTKSTTQDEVNKNLATMARGFAPNLYEPLFTKVIQAAAPVTIDSASGMTVRSNTTLSDFMRFAIACDANVLKERGIENPEAVSEEDLMRAVNLTLKDLPDYSSKEVNNQPNANYRPGFMPWISVDFDTSPGSRDFITTQNYGMPIKISSLKGESGIDYLKFMVNPQGRAANIVKNSDNRFTGAVTPTLNQVPLLMINSIYKDQNGVTHNEDLMADGMRKLNLGFSGAWHSLTVGNAPLPRYGKYLTSSSGQAISPNDSMIMATNEPYMPKMGQEIFGNTLVDQPLKNAATAIAFVHQSGEVLERIVDSDPTLKVVKPLLYQAAYLKGTKAPDDSNAFLSPANLQKLYDKAVANGAKTNADFIGYVFGAMKMYSENPHWVEDRDFMAQKDAKASLKDDIVSDGAQKGRILWKSSSIRFVDVVKDQLKSGKNIYVGPTPNDPNGGLAFFALSSNEVPPMLTKLGYTIAATPDKISDIEQSTLGKASVQQKENDRVRSILFGSNNDVDTTGVSYLARSTTLPSDMQAKYRSSFMEFVSRPDIKDNPNLPYYDLKGYYSKFGKMPDSLDKVPEQFVFIPKETVKIQVVYGDSSGTPVMVPYTTSDTSPELKNRQEKASTELYNVYAEIKKDIAYKEEAKAFMAKQQREQFQDVNDWINNHLVGTDTLDAYRQEKYQEEHFQDTVYWMHDNLVDKDTPDADEDQQGEDPVAADEKTMNLVHYISTTPVNALPEQVKNTISSEAINNLKHLTEGKDGWTPAQLEYQIDCRRGMYGETVATALENLDKNAFILTPQKAAMFKKDLEEASKKIGMKFTEEGIADFVHNPNKFADFKRNYFTLTLYPDGLLSRHGISQQQTRVDALIELLRSL